MTTITTGGTTDAAATHAAGPTRRVMSRPTGRQGSPGRLEPRLVGARHVPFVLVAPAPVDSTEEDGMLALRDEIGRLLPGTRVELAFAEGPTDRIEDMLRERRTPSVVLPLSLAPDPRLTIALSDAVRQAVVPHHVAEHLGPHDWLARAYHDRLSRAGVHRGDSVVFASTGHCGPAPAQTAAMSAIGAMLHQRHGFEVSSVVVTPHGRELAHQIAHHRQHGTQNVVVAPYCLTACPRLEIIQRIARRDGASSCLAPIGDHPQVLELIAARYAAAAHVLVTPYGARPVFNERPPSRQPAAVGDGGDSSE
jgi:hypothetical protein